MKPDYRLGWTCPKCGRRVHNPRRSPPRCCKRAMVNDAAKAGQMDMIEVTTLTDEKPVFIPGAEKRGVD